MKQIAEQITQANIPLFISVSRQGLSAPPDYLKRRSELTVGARPFDVALVASKRFDCQAALQSLEPPVSLVRDAAGAPRPRGGRDLQ